MTTSVVQVMIIFDRKAEMIFDLDQDRDTKDMLMAKFHYMRMLSVLFPFENVDSLNINLRFYDFKNVNCLDTLFFICTSPKKKKSWPLRKQLPI